LETYGRFDVSARKSTVRSLGSPPRPPGRSLVRLHPDPRPHLPLSCGAARAPLLYRPCSTILCRLTSCRSSLALHLSPLIPRPRRPARTNSPIAAKSATVLWGASSPMWSWIAADDLSLSVARVQRRGGSNAAGRRGAAISRRRRLRRSSCRAGAPPAASWRSCRLS
jgi:hypothetical protein